MATITSQELKRKLDSGPVMILDVREPFEYVDWHIPGAVNIPVSRVIRNPDLDAPKDVEIVAVCAHGIRSAAAVRYLSMAGFENVFSLTGGMVEWNGIYDFVEINGGIVQVRRVGKGCLSYILSSGGEAVIIDPTIDVDVYMNWAKERDLTVIAVLDTHAHADHATGGRVLAKRGIPYYAPEECNAGIIKDGDAIDFGSASISAVSAPGHTTGSLAYSIGSFLLTGDTLFVDAVGRPDLGQNAEENTPILYDTIQKLLALPGDTIVLPGHSEIDAIRKEVPIKETMEGLKELDILKKPRGEFILWISESRPPPENFEIIREYNTGKIVIDTIDEFRELEAGANRCAVR